MPPDRSIAAALARFFLAFALMVAPWPGLGSAFAEAVGAIATAAADPISAASNVTFLLRSPKPSENQPEWRAVVSVRQDFPDGPVDHAGAIDLRRAGYLQLVTFVALAAAWPPRGWPGALLATAIALAIVATAIALPILAFLSPIGVVHLGPWLQTLLSLASRALVAAPGMAFAIPGLAWLAVRGGGLGTRILSAAAGPVEAPPHRRARGRSSIAPEVPGGSPRVQPTAPRRDL
jgi:hypothetical protein